MKPCEFCAPNRVQIGGVCLVCGKRRDDYHPNLDGPAEPIGTAMDAPASVLDEVAMSIKAANLIAGDLHTLYTQVGDKLDYLWDAISRVQQTDGSESLTKLQQRIDRLQELRRMAEAGAFKLQVARTMDEAWKRLP